MASAPFSRFLSGSLVIEFRGGKLDSFIPLLVAQGVSLSQIRVGKQKAVATASLRDFDEIYKLCRQNRIRMRFLDRKGLPFLCKRLWMRPSMGIGAVLFLFILLFASSVIWKVDVTSPSEEVTAEVRDFAKELGIYQGAWRWNMKDVDELQKELLAKHPDLVWVGVRVSGSTVHIEALPKIKAPKAMDTRPHNVVASKLGVIRYVFTTRGTTVVKPGQLVYPGQTLISAALAGSNSLVPASGTCLAEVWYTSDVTIPLSVQDEGLTGLSTKRDYLLLGSFAIRAWGWKDPNYKATYEADHDDFLHIGTLSLPIGWRQATIYEVNKNKSILVESQASERGLEIARQDVRTQVGSQASILSQTVLHRKVSHGTLYETVLTRTEENIGISGQALGPAQSEKIPKGTTN